MSSTENFTEISADALQIYRKKLTCNFPQVEAEFPKNCKNALDKLTEKGLDDYFSGASLVCMIGRGAEPVLNYLQQMPEIAQRLGEPVLEIVSQAVWQISRTPNGNSIPPLMQSIAAICERIASVEQLQKLFVLIFDFMNKSTGSVHGIQATHASPGLPILLNQLPFLLSQLSLQGLTHWVEYGARNYQNHPDRQKNYFNLESADSKAVLQRERQGTLLIDHLRPLEMFFRALWHDEGYFIPYSLSSHEALPLLPYYDDSGIRLPDVLDDFSSELGQVSAIDRYRLTIAHMAAHRRWSTTMIADNFSPFQRLAIEHLEDSRVDYLLLKKYPGLRKWCLLLHPKPIEGSCQSGKQSCVRHRLAMLSRAILDPQHGYKNPTILDFVERFYQRVKADGSSTKAMIDLGIDFTTKTRLQSDQLPNIRFDNTVVNYRDDNRHLWVYIEENDEAEDYQSSPKKRSEEPEQQGLPPRLYDEWDYLTSSYKPDWVSLYESEHSSTSPTIIDNILQKHQVLAKRLKQILEQLKPQRLVRVRYQEDGSELDLDIAIRSIIDYKSGAQPDPRINMSHKNDGRDIAVMILLDLSASLNDPIEGSEQSILQLSQEAVSLLAWTIEELGDQYAIAGFHSDTRNNLSYYHIKGYSESLDDKVKSRLAAMEAGYSTRMGGAIRHASHYLQAQQAEKKLMIIVTDGEPSDVDVSDKQYLISDTKKAIDEISSKGMSSYCISLDRKADDYIQELFGKGGYSIIDNLQKLPEKLPLLFASLTS